MVGLLLTVSLAQAGAGSAGLTVDAVGGDVVSMRPGVRLGYEPVPTAALELLADADPTGGGWDGGLGLSGKVWLTPGTDTGLYLLGRFSAGLSGSAGEVGPWTGISGGFGGRPLPWLDLAASFGPSWDAPSGARWRTELGVSWVMGAGSGTGNARHRVRRVPG